MQGTPEWQDGVAFVSKADSEKTDVLFTIFSRSKVVDFIYSCSQCILGTAPSSGWKDRVRSLLTPLLTP